MTDAALACGKGRKAVLGEGERARKDGETGRSRVWKLVGKPRPTLTLDPGDALASEVLREFEGDTSAGMPAPLARLALELSSRGFGPFEARRSPL